MVMVKATEESEAGIMPLTELLEAMGKYNEELVNAGIMKAGEGLHPSSKGKRVAFNGPQRTVTDGPFAETKELIAGFLALGGQRHGRGGRVGEALPEPDARPQRDRDPPAFRGGGSRRRAHPELREQEERLRDQLETQAS